MSSGGCLVWQDHIFFVGTDNDRVMVLTNRSNGKIWKRKKAVVGFIARHPVSHKYCFQPVDNWSYPCEVLSAISLFMVKLANGLIKYDTKTGDLTMEESNMALYVRTQDNIYKPKYLCDFWNTKKGVFCCPLTKAPQSWCYTEGERK